MLWLVFIVLLVLAVVVIKKVQAAQRKQKRNLRKREAAKKLYQLDALPEPLPPLLPKPLPPALPIPTIQPPLSLSSDAGIDYTQLQDLLKAMRWQEADIQTREILLKLTACEKLGYIDSQGMQKLPCTDLKTIDRLWLTYSNDHFGFSVQNRLWQESEQDCSRFGELVGWSKHGVFIKECDLIYDLSTPDGNLPVAYIPVVGGCLWIILDSISLLYQFSKEKLQIERQEYKLVQQLKQ